MFNTTEKRERSLGIKLFLKAERCSSGKCAVIRSPFRPGAHGKARRRALSEVGQQLQEKQKIKYTYGLREAQLQRVFTAASEHIGVTGEMIIGLLERRLDSVVYRLGITLSRSVARQAINHGHIFVNGRRVNVPSYSVRAGDVITVRPQSQTMPLFKELATAVKKVEPPVWLEFDAAQLTGKVITLPREYEMPFDVTMVVDYYSK